MNLNRKETRGRKSKYKWPKSKEWEKFSIPASPGACASARNWAKKEGVSVSTWTEKGRLFVVRAIK